jgi:DNA-directed RNA polymerase specialized sigma24 family protein
MDLQGDAGATQRSRAGESLITPPPFEAVWPDVERCLHALLYRRGLDRASADDVVQEVALRALAGRVTYTSAKDLLRWAGPVACNLHIDLLRQRARLSDDEVGADRPASNDVAGEVADRMELQRALRGIAALRPADREAIMEAVTAEPVPPRNRKEAVRLAVRRHRARSRLILVMEQLAAFVFGWRWVRQPKAATAAVAMVPVMAALPLLFVTPVPPEAPTRPVPPRVATPVTRSVPVRAALTAAPPKAVPAPAPAAKRAVPVRPQPQNAPAATPKPDVEIEGPSDIKIRGRGHDRPPGTTYVFCVWNVPELDRDVCVDRPRV